MPEITGAPTLDTPPLLDWPLDRPPVTPNLGTPTANVLLDVHGELADCGALDLVLSSEGNYHMALRDLWFEVLLPRSGDRIRSWLYTTSPPIAPDQAESAMLEVGNLRLRCRPQVAVAGLPVMRQLAAMGATEGEPTAVYRTQGVVLLVNKGNPLGLRTVWDLAREAVHLVTPNPAEEPGAFRAYLDTLHGVATQDPSPPPGLTAEGLVDAVFNRGPPGRWLAGARIHHRDVPWSVAFGRADVGLLHYHLARWAVRSFPDRFELVPLGGTAERPRPLPGNVVREAYLVKLAGPWTARQLRAREDLVEALGSDDFTRILAGHGLVRPG